MKKYSVVQLQSFFIVYPYGKQCCFSALELFHCLPRWITVRLHGKKLQNATNKSMVLQLFFQRESVQYVHILFSIILYVSIFFENFLNYASVAQLKKEPFIDLLDRPRSSRAKSTFSICRRHFAMEALVNHVRSTYNLHTILLSSPR